MKKLYHSTWECDHGRACSDLGCGHRGNHDFHHGDCDVAYSCALFTRPHGGVTIVRCAKFQNGKVVPS